MHSNNRFCDKENQHLKTMLQQYRIISLNDVEKQIRELGGGCIIIAESFGGICKPQIQQKKIAMNFLIADMLNCMMKEIKCYLQERLRDNVKLSSMIYKKLSSSISIIFCPSK